jgi:epoxyqueuosine reductase
MGNKTHSQQIKQQAKILGFEDCGISRAQHLEGPSQHLKDWLNKGYHAGMQYMENHFDKRTDPRLLVEGAQSVISVILNYYPENKQAEGTYKISKYAYGEDYHFVMKRKLKSLLQFIQQIEPQTEGRAFVDSAPVMDREWARRAGLGWIGKHSLLINKGLGSFVFIGELIVNLELEYDTPINEYCGTCTRCIEACPTHAIVADKVVDSNKCISYQTIENKGEIDAELKGKFNNYIFGCDICQDVCPWNRKSKAHNETAFQPNPSFLLMDKKDWRNMDRETFNALFKNSPLKRAKFEGIRRNMEFLEDIK